eukprot:COSAG04_NODE_951_length_9210_cov_890.580178_9_plen_149_part_00
MRLSRSQAGSRCAKRGGCSRGRRRPRPSSSWCSGTGCSPRSTCPRYASSCTDHTSSSDWLFGLWPGPPQRFEHIGTNTDYQGVGVDRWPQWGRGGGDLTIGGSGAPGGSGYPGGGFCYQGHTYRGTEGEICGGSGNWGATDVEVWYPI